VLGRHGRDAAVGVSSDRLEGATVVKKTPEVEGSRPVCGYKEAVAITGLKKTKLYDLFHRGVLRGYRDGSMIRFHRTALLTYMRERENAPPPPEAGPAVPQDVGGGPVQVLVGLRLWLSRSGSRFTLAATWA